LESATYVTAEAVTHKHFPVGTLAGLRRGFLIIGNHALASEEASYKTADNT
jgi:hypothetical protein